MRLIICGNWTTRRKPCKHCRHFFLGGISTGYCGQKKSAVTCDEHCKYYKRDSKIWTKDGKCKVDENELYA